MSYEDAMTRFGSDKPDLRFGMELKIVTDLFKGSDFKVFADAVERKETVAVLNASGCSGYSRKNLDDLQEYAKKYGAKGIAWMKIEETGVNSPIAKFLDEKTIEALKIATDAKVGDLLLFASAPKYRCCTILGALRLEVARRQGIMDKIKKDFSFHWVLEFPLFEHDEEANRYVAMHHPFTSPMEEDMQYVDTDPSKIRAKAYDLVVNGAELGGGSIRIHNGELQSKMFSLIGITKEEAESKFGFLLEALKYGAPPHGGIALGLDRVVMTLAGTDNIRDVIAFPKTTSGLSLMDGAPSTVDDAQLQELGIRIIEK
jgi:aspartyl-tRNA synthetase